MRGCGKWHLYSLSTACKRVSMLVMKLIGFIFAAGSISVLSSCSLVQQQSALQEDASAEMTEQRKADSKKDRENTDDAVRPTPEQMESAVQALQEAENSELDAAGADEMPAAENGEDVSVSVESPSEAIPGGLRMGRFAPPEEAVSSSENDVPAPNSVELHGLRSPNLKGGKLPMSIDGKINKTE